MDFYAPANQVLILFVLILIGYIARKLDVIKESFNEALSDLVIYISLPSMLITSLNYPYSPDMFMSSLKFILYSFVYYFVIYILSFAFLKFIKDEEKIKAIYQFMILFSNVGFMGYPVVNAVYGRMGVFYTAIYNLPFNLLLWTLGIYVINGKEKKVSFLKNAFNIGSVSVILGFLLFSLSIKLPEPIFKALELLGNTTTPISMVFIGALLGNVSFKSIVDLKLFYLCFIRLLLLPALTFFILFALIGNSNPYMVGIPTLIAAMPAAANTAIFAEKFGGDPLLASKGIFLTTFFSIFTIPAVVILIKLFLK